MRYYPALPLYLALVTSIRAASIPNRNQSSHLSNLAANLASFGYTLSTDAERQGSPTAYNFSDHDAIGALVEGVSHPIQWDKSFRNWSSFKANGVNLGSWLEIETGFVDVLPAEYLDEWTFCEAEGKEVCGPVLEEHYKTFFTTEDIDNYAKVGINTIRIATTYACWYAVPGSQLYTGNQLVYLKEIVDHAIYKGMHVVIDLHSLPGGINTLEIGEAIGHNDWWYNATNFDYSMKVVDEVLDFIQHSADPQQITFEPINEPTDNFTLVFTPLSVSYPNGVNYLNTYFRAVYDKIQKVNKHIPLMLSDTFAGAAYWARPSGSTVKTLPLTPTSTARFASEDFPVFIGEFSLQAFLNNTFSLRQQIYQTQVYNYAKYMSGSALWTGKDQVPVNISGEGSRPDYWSLDEFIKGGIALEDGEIINSYC